MTWTPLPSETFSSVDAAWLHMDTPTNLANITGVISFPALLDFARLRATVEARILPYIRFRQRISEPAFSLGLPRWELDPNFDLDYHLQHISLPASIDQNALQDLVSELMSIPLDRSRPLWQFLYIENVSGGSALVTRLHHCIADGVALTQVVLSLTDETADAPWPGAQELPRHEVDSPARFCLPAIKAAKTIRSAWHITGNMLHEGMDVLVHPSRLGKAARYGAASSLAFSKLLLIPPDRRTILKKKCGIAKRVAWSTEIQVEDVRNVGRTMGGTINDILLSAVTGAVRRYLVERGESVQGLNIRAMVPVNLRSTEEEELGNRFGLIYLSLPIGVHDPLKRLIVLKQRMDSIKNSPEAVVAFGILNLIGMTPTQIEKIIVPIFGVKATAVMTNVPGPRQTLYLAGEPISSMIFWVPSPANLSLGVSILSYAGDVILGVASDANIIPDPERIIELFQAEFQYLKRWGHPPGHDRTE